MSSEWTERRYEFLAEVASEMRGRQGGFMREVGHMLASEADVLISGAEHVATLRADLQRAREEVAGHKLLADKALFEWSEMHRAAVSRAETAERDRDEQRERADSLARPLTVEAIKCAHCGRIGLSVNSRRITPHKCFGQWEMVVQAQYTPQAAAPEAPPPEQGAAGYRHGDSLHAAIYGEDGNAAMRTRRR